ncbi:MAG: hypothetical protein QNJ88_15560 [Acidimicrobiia bacterium]|nr:hypothetical protein [Acidimicrobiia bacterium]
MHYRFTRTAIPTNFTESRDFAGRITAYLQANHGMDIAMGVQVFSGNRIAWTVNYASLQEWEDTQAKLMADESYQAMIADAAEYFVAGTVLDSMLAFMD